MKIIKHILLLVGAIVFDFTLAQFDPAAGFNGSKAIHADSSIIINWAKHAKLERGWLNIADTSLGKASVGSENDALNRAMSNGVVSLGDGGSIIVSFEYPIYNGQGPDFAVFENGLNDGYLELAFVEVSSDGINYYRFPSVSNTDTVNQLDNFGQLDATKLNNLASKYRLGYGTPFDLEELKNLQGLNIDSIIYIKIIDAIGSINDSFCTRDNQGHKINDPWPTPYPSCGFDLDAVGVIHEINYNSLTNVKDRPLVQISPNPFNHYIQLNSIENIHSVAIYDIKGQLIFSDSKMNSNMIHLESLPVGIYQLEILSKDFRTTYKIIKTNE